MSRYRAGPEKYTRHVVDIIGAPFDLCGMRLGSRLGPAAIRLAGLAEALHGLGLAAQDLGDVAVDLNPTSGPGMRNFQPLLECIRLLKSKVAGSIEAGRLPVVLGGEHTLAVAGVSAALKAYGENLAVLWIDAHADVNTPGSSATGNIHGMPISALWGTPSEAEAEVDAQWQELLNLLGPAKLEPTKTAWFGLRDVDVSERHRMHGLPVTMHDVDRYGVDACVGMITRWLGDFRGTHLWISFDVDALDPILAPGTGTAVRGGLTYREAHLLAELLHEALRVSQIQLAGVDLVETNPLVDRNNETAQVAVEWIASLFGKTILGNDLLANESMARKGR